MFLGLSFAVQAVSFWDALYQEWLLFTIAFKIPAEVQERCGEGGGVLRGPRPGAFDPQAYLPFVEHCVCTLP